MAGSRQARRELTGILLLDKPLGLSSNDALQRCKRLYRAAKAGHTGSLDPLASGMLPLCFGRATRLSGILLESDKRYLATVRLGERTATGDAEGEVIATSDPSGLSQAALQAVLSQFQGPTRQVPPMYSALKHQGQRLYTLARAGLEVAREAREVVIHALQLTRFGDRSFELDIRCSKGTYVRTLAEDIAAAAGQCAHLSALRRLEVAPFGAGPLVGLEALEQAAAAEGEAALDRYLIAPAAALAHWPQLRIDAVRAHYLAQGQAVRVAEMPAAGLLAVLDGEGALLGIAEAGRDGLLVPRKWLAAPQ